MADSPLFKAYSAKTKTILAVQLTEENIDQVALRVGGEVRVENTTNCRCIVPTHRKKHTPENKARYLISPRVMATEHVTRTNIGGYLVFGRSELLFETEMAQNFEAEYILEGEMDPDSSVFNTYHSAEDDIFAVLITEENMEAVAIACNGTIVHHEIHQTRLLYPTIKGSSSVLVGQYLVYRKKNNRFTTVNVPAFERRLKPDIHKPGTDTPLLDAMLSRKS